jgi:hypothetical protein
MDYGSSSVKHSAVNNRRERIITETGHPSTSGGNQNQEEMFEIFKNNKGAKV